MSNVVDFAPLTDDMRERWRHAASERIERTFDETFLEAIGPAPRARRNDDALDAATYGMLFDAEAIGAAAPPYMRRRLDELDAGVFAATSVASVRFISRAEAERMYPVVEERMPPLTSAPLSEAQRAALYPRASEATAQRRHEVNCQGGNVRTSLSSFHPLHPLRPAAVYGMDFSV